MCIRDRFQVILLAPALADDWKKGSATGLRTRGGLKVDLAWQNGRVQDVYKRQLLLNFRIIM